MEKEIENRDGGERGGVMEEEKEEGGTEERDDIKRYSQILSTR